MVFPLFLLAQYKFNKATATGEKDGLPDSNVNAITKDIQGLISGYRYFNLIIGSYC